MAIRILLADDQPLIRAGLAMLLDSEPDIEVIGTADDGRQAVDRARTTKPDVVLMDVRMPVLDGVSATRLITEDAGSLDPARPVVKVLILTTYHVDDAVYAALRAGASGFLLKDAAPTELAAAVRAVAAGEAWLDPAVARRLIDEFAERPEPYPAAGLDRLTAREREVLTQVARGLSNIEIAMRLHVGEGTVKTHFGRILVKLGVRDRAQAVMVAYESGLVQPRRSPRQP
ncbi:response regulator transcription factor [Micromonospora sp. WMMD1082]|uniref:response regulator transcription factor n=1 Tax=Micromonospora sp. WMMD1082 TaxID=3016104 RepID=UPI002416B75A|nr:response regulator transcription factor [Micromonospora sp. WMMD1082]MDG4796879.1 response regulator transcription factor [Micromonospora sp. WMMD1082]